MPLIKNVQCRHSNVVHSNITFAQSYNIKNWFPSYYDIIIKIMNNCVWKVIGE